MTGSRPGGWPAVLITAGIAVVVAVVVANAPRRLPRTSLPIAFRDDAATSRHRPFVAHNGGGDDFPELSMAGVEAALGVATGGAAASFAGIELDSQVTADGVLVAFHDASVGDDTDGSGLVRDLTWKVVAELDARKAFCVPGRDGEAAGRRGANQARLCRQPIRVHQTAELVDAVLAASDDAVLVLEIKPFAAVDAVADAMARLFESRPALYERAVVLSFMSNILHAVGDRDPGIARVLLLRDELIGHACRVGAFDRASWLCWGAPAIDALALGLARCGLTAWFLGLAGLGVHAGMVDLTPPDGGHDPLVASLSRYCLLDGASMCYLWGLSRAAWADATIVRPDLTSRLAATAGVYFTLDAIPEAWLEAGP